MEKTTPWSIHHVIVLDDDILHCSAAQERWLGGWNFEDVYLDNTQKMTLVQTPTLSANGCELPSL